MPKQQIIVFLIVIGFLGILPVSAQTTPTSSQGEWGILFESNTNGRNGLYWMPPDANTVDQIVSYDTLLKTYSGFTNGFNLSPDGRQIAISVSVMSFDNPRFIHPVYICSLQRQIRLSRCCLIQIPPLSPPFPGRQMESSSLFAPFQSRMRLTRA